MRFLSHADLPSKGITYSKAHIWRLRKAGKFPDPVKGLGPEDSYREDEIDQYVAARVAARDSEQAA